MEIDDVTVDSIDDYLVTSNLNISNKATTSTKEYLVPNPAHRGQLTKLLIEPKVINEVNLINLDGQLKKINLIPIDTKNISFILDFTTSRGFHTLEIIKKDGSILIKKMIVE